MWIKRNIVHAGEKAILVSLCLGGLPVETAGTNLAKFLFCSVTLLSLSSPKGNNRLSSMGEKFEKAKLIVTLLLREQKVSSDLVDAGEGIFITYKCCWLKWSTLLLHCLFLV